MLKTPIKIISGNFFNDGFIIIESENIKKRIIELKNEFKKFKGLFGNDKLKNRNILKRFSDSFCVSRIFSSNYIHLILNKHLNIKHPVFCGPIFSHYTSYDKTGDGYALPYHQDWPSMASSKNSLIMWFSLNDCSKDSHSIAILRGKHNEGLLPGKQDKNGYEINITDDLLETEEVLTIKAGQILFMSSLLPHKTFINKNSKISKISLSRRIDDFNCKEWGKRNYINAYHNKVDRNLFLT